MQKHNIIDLKLENGDIISIEISDQDTSRTKAVGRLSSQRGIMNEAQQSFESIFEVVKPVASSVFAKAKDIANSPSEISIEFGIKLSATGGVIISSASMEANFTVGIKWINTK